MASSSLASKYGSFLTIFSGDLIFIISIFIILFALTMYFGRGRAVSLILAFYPATLLYTTFPFLEKLMFLGGEKLLVLNKLAVFLVFLIPISIIINRFVFSASEYTGSNNMVRSGGLALSILILIMVFSYGTLNLDIFHDFGPQIDSLFSTANLVFYWNLASIALLALL